MKSSGSNSSGSGSGETKIERKTIEKQRRMQMKSLSLRLASLIPKPKSSQAHSDGATQLDNLEEAASYIINLRNRIQELKNRKEAVAKRRTTNYDCKFDSKFGSTNEKSSFKLPLIEVRYHNPNLEVVLVINATSHKLTFHNLIRIIEDEGVDVVNASHSTLGDKVVFSIHSQVRNPRSGVEASRISNTLKDWIYMQNV